MTHPGDSVAQAALELVGCPFRLHGRDPASGIDCVGLIAAALTAIGVRPVAPGGYALRNLGIDHWLPFAAQSGLIPVTGETKAGDILLIALGFAQHHLVIAADTRTVVHAHAGLRRVVHQPRDPAWRVTAHWRIAPLQEG